MNLTILRIVLLNLLVWSILGACTDQNPIEDNPALSESGSIRFGITLPAGGNSQTRVAAGTPEEIVNYPSDFQVDKLNCYLFGSNGRLVKSYLDVNTQLSEESTTSDITLENAPAGNNQTLLCVANPDEFPGMENITQGVSLDEMLRLTNRPIEDSEGANMFMTSGSNVNVNAGATNNVTASLVRGVARLDVFTADAAIGVDSVVIVDVPSLSYLNTQTGMPGEKVSLRKSLSRFEGRSKVGYLNESKDAVKLKICFTHEEVPGVVNLTVPSLVRNNIYSVNLEVANGTHLVSGTLSVTAWTNNVLEGEVDAELSFDRDATLSSFRMEDGGSVSFMNDTTLVLPKGKGAGLLCFRSGAESSVALVNEQDSAILAINRNAVTRGSIKTAYDVSVMPYETAEENSTRDVQLWVCNLLTGEGRVFIVRQNATGYVRVNVPALNFTNSHRYSVNVSLPNVSEVSQLTFPVDPAFTVSATKSSANTFNLVISRKRIYDIVPLNKQFVVTKNGNPVVKLNMTPDRGFSYEEMQLGDVTFMDRDLGAKAANQVGELFIPGSLLPINQSGFSNGETNGFVGQGRPSPGNVAFNTSTTWFTGADNVKNIAVDPCPEGWHVATISDFQKIMTQATGEGSNNVFTNQGSLHTTVTIDKDRKNVAVVLGNKTLNFPWLNGGQWDSRFNQINNYPIAWWSSTKNSSGLYNHLSFKVDAPYKVEPRIHNSTVNSKRGYNIRCVKDGNSAPTAIIPTVRLGGKEWMAFNSYGAGDAVQKVIQPWESVEDTYRNHWTETLGMLFQWGRKYAHNQWTVYQNNPGAQGNIFSDWNRVQEAIPCPDGYRVPTRQELAELLPNISLPAQATYLYGGERIRASLHRAVPPHFSNWHGYSGEARYLKLTSVETGNYLIIPLAGSKPDKQSGANPALGVNFRLWASNLYNQAADSGRATALMYGAVRDVAIPTFEDTRPKEAYSSVRCIKK